MTRCEARVIWLEAPGRLAIRSEPLAQPGAQEVLCETIVSAISPGTELAAWRGSPPLRPGAQYPRLQGYCNVARVVAAGAAVTRARVGDRVLSFASHRSHHLLAESEILYRLPDDACADTIVSAYLFHLGYNAVLRGSVRPGSRVLVAGLGVLGLASVALAAIAGAEVYAVSDHAKPTRIARGYGAREIFTRADRAGLADALAPGADVVIGTTNGWEDFALALEAAGPNGVIACLGFPGRGDPPGAFNPLDSRHFYTKQLRIESVGFSPEHPDSRGFNRFNERANIAWLAGLIESGRLDPAPILSGRYEAGDIARAYADLEARRDGALTYLLDWQA